MPTARSRSTLCGLCNVILDVRVREHRGSSSHKAIAHEVLKAPSRPAAFIMRCPVTGTNGPVQRGGPRAPDSVKKATVTLGQSLRHRCPPSSETLFNYAGLLGSRYTGG